MKPPPRDLGDPDIDGAHATFWPKKGSPELADPLELTVRGSILSAPIGALLATSAYVHFLGDPPFCDGQGVMLPIAGGFLGWLIWCLWSKALKPFAPGKTRLICLNSESRSTTVVQWWSRRHRWGSGRRFHMPEMRRKPMFRLKVRTLVALVGLASLVLWAAVNWLSPTRRFGRLVQPDQPAYVRAESVGRLGHGIPAWEVDQAVGILIASLEDSNPIVRQYAAAALAEHGHRAERAIPGLLRFLEEPGESGRFTAALALGHVTSPGSADCQAVVAALGDQLDDPRGFNRLAACEALIMLGESKKAAGTIASALCGPDDGARVFAEDRLRRRGISSREVAGWIAPELLDKDANHRQRALEWMTRFAPAGDLHSALSRAATADDETLRTWAARKLESLAVEPGRD